MIRGRNTKLWFVRIFTIVLSMTLMASAFLNTLEGNAQRPKTQDIKEQPISSHQEDIEEILGVQETQQENSITSEASGEPPGVLAFEQQFYVWPSKEEAEKAEKYNIAPPPPTDFVEVDNQQPITSTENGDIFFEEDDFAQKSLTDEEQESFEDIELEEEVTVTFEDSPLEYNFTDTKHNDNEKPSNNTLLLEESNIFIKSMLSETLLSTEKEEPIYTQYNENLTPEQELYDAIRIEGYEEKVESNETSISAKEEPRIFEKDTTSAPKQQEIKVIPIQSSKDVVKPNIQLSSEDEEGLFIEGENGSTNGTPMYISTTSWRYNPSSMNVGTSYSFGWYVQTWDWYSSWPYPLYYTYMHYTGASGSDYVWGGYWDNCWSVYPLFDFADGDHSCRFTPTQVGWHYFYIYVYQYQGDGAGPYDWLSGISIYASKPDLYWLDIWTEPGTVYEGQSVRFWFKEYNGGGSDAGYHYDYFYLDNVHRWTGDHSLKKGYTYNWRTPWTTVSAGWHKLECRADYYNWIPELNEWNNYAYLSFYCHPTPKPDLYWTNIWTEPSHVVEGEYVRFWFSEYNGGSADAGYHYDYFYLDSVLRWTGDHSLGRGHTRNWRTLWTTVSAGWHNLECRADYYDWVDESNERNNHDSWWFYCYPAPKPDLITENIWYTDELYAGYWSDSHTIYARIRNQGQGTAGSSYAGIYADGSRIATIYVDSIGVGSYRDISFRIDGFTVGYHRVGVYADVYNNVPESNEGNNYLERTWYWKAHKWLYMTYMDGDNNLEYYAITDLNRMERQGSTNDVVIVAQLDRRPGFDTSNGDWRGTRRYVVKQDPYWWWDNTIRSTQVGSEWEANMGHPNTLSDFAKWAMRRYPAENYYLVQWDHGSGAMWGGALGGACWDDTNWGDYLTLPEIKSAMANIRNYRGSNIEVLQFYACLMEMIEVVYQVKGTCDIVVGSEELMYVPSWYSYLVCDRLASNPAISPRDIASYAVDAYAYLDGPGKSTDTQAAFWTSTISYTLTSAVSTLGYRLKQKMSTYRTEIIRAANEAEHFDTIEYKDLYHFSELIYNYIADSEIRNAAQDVMNKIDLACINERHRGGHPNAHGISIYNPSPTAYQSNYESLDFARNTWWDEYLILLSDIIPPQTYITSGPSGIIYYRDVTFVWTSSDANGIAGYYYRIDFGPWFWTTSTSKSYYELGDGEHKFEVKAKDKAGNIDPTPATRTFTISQNDANSGGDAGDSFADALLIVPASYDGYMYSEDNVDWYQFYVVNGQIINIGMTPPSGADFDIALYDPYENWKDSSTYGGDTEESITYTADSSGYWRLEVYIWSGKGDYSFFVSLDSAAYMKIKVTNSDDDHHYAYYNIDGGSFDNYVSVWPSSVVYSERIAVSANEYHTAQVKWFDIDSFSWYYSDEVKFYLPSSSTVIFPFFIGIKPQALDDLIDTVPYFKYESDEHPSINDYALKFAYMDNVNVPSMVTGATAKIDISHTYIGDMIIWIGYIGGPTQIIHNREGGSADDLHLEENLFDLGYTREDFETNHRWYLRIYDAASGDEGMLDSFMMIIDNSYGFTLKVAFNWDVSQTYMDNFVAGMRLASNYLYDVTDGYMCFNEVEFRDNISPWDIYWYTTDIRVGQGVADEDDPMDDYWPHCDGIGPTFNYIYMPERFHAHGCGNWNQCPLNQPTWDPTDEYYYRTIIHEFGHYLLYLNDEYGNAGGCAANLWTDSASSIMDSQYERSELCTPLTHNHANTGQTISCWETVFNHYFTLIDFDLNGDGVRDTNADSNGDGVVDVLENYVVDSGAPNDVYSGQYDVGQYMIADIHNT